LCSLIPLHTNACVTPIPLSPIHSITSPLNILSYTPLFRSGLSRQRWPLVRPRRWHRVSPAAWPDPPPGARFVRARQRPRHGADRSEEHTSELQSRENLVCRLLLAKKKRNVQIHQYPRNHLP